MQFIINGEKKDIEAATARHLVEQMGLGQQAVAVEINGKIIPKRLQAQTKLTEGDTIELVTLVGGG